MKYDSICIKQVKFMNIIDKGLIIFSAAISIWLYIA